MSDGKNAVGLTGFPTPNTAAGIAGYLLFLFEDKEWSQWILGALEPLAYAYNYYESGDLTTDEAAEAFRVIVQQAPYNLKTCANPSGGRILRVAPNGKVQELNDANEWQDPTGDYTIPPVPEREGGTEEDQICLASKNAANVLQLLYENVTDSFNADLDATEAASALTLGIIGLIGAEFAPITFALVTFFAIVFGVLYGLLEFIGADLWDEDFTAVLVCLLNGCASNDSGVVTFDYECFNQAMAAQVVIRPLTFDQLRLFGQIQYLLLVIGGVDALNAAGATTAITDDDCTDCEATWCYRFDDENRLGDWSPGFWSHPTDASFPTYSSGVWNEGLSPTRISYITISWVFSPAITITDAAILMTTAPQMGGGQGVWINGSDPAAPFAGGDGALIWGYDSGFVPDIYTGVNSINITLRALDIGMPSFTLSEMQFSGIGDNPFGDDNC